MSTETSTEVEYDVRVAEPDPTRVRRGSGAVRRLGYVRPALSTVTPAIDDPDGSGSVLVREAASRRMLALADAFAAVVSFLLVSAITGHGTDLVAVAVAPLVILIHKMAGLYDRDELVIHRSTLDEIPTLFQLSGLYALVVSLSSGVLFAHRLGADGVLGLWIISLALVCAGRMAARAVVSRTFPPERCLVIGDTERIRYVRNKLAAAKMRADVVASVQCTVDRPHGIDCLDDLRELVERCTVHRVIIAPMTDSLDTVEVIRMAKAVGVRVSVLPRTLEAVGSAVEFDEIDGLTMLGIRRFGLGRSSRRVKRCFDLVVASFIAAAVAPLIALVAVAIRLDTPGPVFFRQRRVGREGEVFRIWKFRSMVCDAEARKHELAALNVAGDGLFKIPDDPRITRVGRFLRRTSLDELPQIFNVLTGDMSLVGPRPLVLDEDARVEGLYRSRLHLTPGMTGPWQVLGSTRVPLDEMVAMDYLYVANWSLWADVKLLVRTAKHVVRQRGL